MLSKKRCFSSPQNLSKIRFPSLGSHCTVHTHSLYLFILSSFTHRFSITITNHSCLRHAACDVSACIVQRVRQSMGPLFCLLPSPDILPLILPLIPLYFWPIVNSTPNHRSSLPRSKMFGMLCLIASGLVPSDADICHVSNEGGALTVEG